MWIKRQGGEVKEDKVRERKTFTSNMADAPIRNNAQLFFPPLFFFHFCQRAICILLMNKHHSTFWQGGRSARGVAWCGRAWRGVAQRHLIAYIHQKARGISV